MTTIYRMKTIYLLCLHNVRTGGPEAIHQLSDSLLKQGFDARMVYYNRGHIARLEGGPIDEEGYHFSDAPEYMRCQFDEYAHYATRIESAVPNSPDAIVVLPEAICHLTPKFNKATVLVWWLSVDNAFGALSRVNLNLLRGVKHASQSYYATDFCHALGLPKVASLSDYTTSLASYAAPRPWVSRERRVAINANPLKVTADLDDLIRQIGAGADCIKIVGFDRAKVAHTLATSRVYIDLGSFPGKDRMPREAASMGCAVLCSERALRDYPFADYVCLANIWRALKEPPTPFSIEAERRQFFDEVREVFGAI